MSDLEIAFSNCYREARNLGIMNPTLEAGFFTATKQFFGKSWEELDHFWGHLPAASTLFQSVEEELTLLATTPKQLVVCSAVGKQGGIWPVPKILEDKIREFAKVPGNRVEFQNHSHGWNDKAIVKYFENV